jgi:hypothetical protein
MAGKGPMRLGVGESGGAAAGLFLLQAEEAPSVAVVERAKRAAEWGEATVRALDVGEGCETRCGLITSFFSQKKKSSSRRTGAFASLASDELERRLTGEGGLKHTEDAQRNPRCGQGHALFSRSHPWTAGLAETRCTVCAAEVPTTSVRFHCVSKLCGGAQACVRCAARYGSELGTALLLSDTGRRALLPSLGRVVEALSEGLHGPGGAARGAVVMAGTAVDLSRPLPLTRALVVSAGVEEATVDPLLAAHDEAHNTDAYRAAGRMQSMRLASVVRELKRRQRAVERALAALEKRAATTVRRLDAADHKANYTTEEEEVEEDAGDSE